MDFNVDNFVFSPDLLKLSGANFKAFLKERYGKDYKAKELKLVFDKFYGKIDIDTNGNDSAIFTKAIEDSE